VNAVPRVLVLTPVKDASAHLPRYAELLEALDWPRAQLTLGMLEGDSRDGTWAQLEALRPRLKARFADVRLFHHNYGSAVPPGVPRWTAAVQLDRRRILARARNRLLMSALGDEDWVLWIDVDMIDCPADLIGQLLATGFDIVTPHAVQCPGGKSFDLNSWAAGGTVHLHDRRGAGAIRLDAVGGTMLLVRADLHRDGLVFPPFPYGLGNSRVRAKAGAWGAGEIETEGLGIMASDMGLQCWGLPDLEVLHKD
jgi:peptide chain release factor subunit 1